MTSKEPVNRQVYFASHKESPAGAIGYVGCSRYGMEFRRKEHEKFARLGFHNFKISKALRKYPRASWIWFVLEDGFETDGQMLIAEKLWIEKLGTRKGYNCTDGGEGCSGLVVTEETREKLRLANLGKKASEQTKQKMALAQNGRVRGPEFSSLMREVAIKAVANGTRRGMLGIKRPTEFGLRMSALQKGRPKSEETKQKMRASWAHRKANGTLWTPRFTAMVKRNFDKGRELRKGNQ